MNKLDGTLIDGPAKYALVRYFTKECISGHYACGFSESKNAPTLLKKTTKNSKQVIINIFNSSISERLNLDDPT